MMKMVTTKELELCEKKVGVVPPADEIAKSREKPRGCGDGEVGRPRGCADGGSRPGMPGRPKAQLELRW